jgi:hypothetical protein
MRAPAATASRWATALVCIAVLAAACAGRRFGPVPSGAPALGRAAETTVLRSGNARIRISSPARKRLRFPLRPSAMYSSAPARLELAYGDPSSGQGLDLQISPVRGGVRTSPDAILTLSLHLAGGGLLQLTSMNGECAVTISYLANDDVAGRFVCHGLRPNVGAGPSVSATGRFEAAA